MNLDTNNYYVKVSYQAVMAIIDAIGSVKIDVPRNMKWDDLYADPPLNINLKKGEQILDGKNTHDFLRWRKNNYGTGYEDGVSYWIYNKHETDKMINEIFMDYLLD